VVETRREIDGALWQKARYGIDFVPYRYPGGEWGRHKFTKEQKQDLMHIAVCSVLMPSGYYEHEGWDQDGWPHFKQLKEYKAMSLFEQENLLKDHILFYFSQNEFL
jgi:hypothetical protein